MKNSTKKKPIDIIFWFILLIQWKRKQSRSHQLLYCNTKTIQMQRNKRVENIEGKNKRKSQKENAIMACALDLQKRCHDVQKLKPFRCCRLPFFVFIFVSLKNCSKSIEIGWRWKLIIWTKIDSSCYSRCFHWQLFFISAV